MRKMARKAVAFIAVGANIQPEDNIRAALAMLHEKSLVSGSSTFFRTEPVDRPDQPRFVNGVWRLDTTLHPLEIRGTLLGPIEKRLGRCRTEDKHAPRTIDLDLVLYDDWEMDDGSVRLPHPDVHRPFVYVPVMELLTDLAAESGSDLPDRIRSLLPQQPGAECPGERLDDFTERLRALLRR
jgi:2-amino-4-hydroxy-6-hydroxymethyldihydropteridine diphosphokinase